MQLLLLLKSDSYAGLSACLVDWCMIVHLALVNVLFWFVACDAIQGCDPFCQSRLHVLFNPGFSLVFVSRRSLLFAPAQCRAGRVGNAILVFHPVVNSVACLLGVRCESTASRWLLVHSCYQRTVHAIRCVSCRTPTTLSKDVNLNAVELIGLVRTSSPNVLVTRKPVTSKRRRGGLLLTLF